MTKYFFYLLLLLSACNSAVQKTEIADTPTKIIRPKYAQGFWIEVFKDHKIIHVRNAYDTTQVIENYIIANNKKSVPDNATFIQVPVRKNVSLSTTQIGFLQELNLIDSIIAVSDAERIFNKNVHANISSGKTQTIGNYNGINEEKILSLQPSLVFAYSFTEGNSSLPKLKSLGLKIVLVNDYNEIHPLARAEWVKMIAAFYDREALADSVFSEVEQEYLQLSEMAKGVVQKPDVFCNLPWKEIWYMPSGKSYFAKFIDNAGGNYLWKNDTSSRTLNLDFEAVFARAAQAPIWLNPNSAKNLKEIGAQDSKFQLFKAFKAGEVFNNNRMENAGGGNAFWETGVAKPNIVLKDLIRIFHPELLPNYQLMYYQKLENDRR